METTHSRPIGGQYSPHQTIKPVNFYCKAPEAHRVEIVGDFTDWRRLTMVRRVDGCWYLQFPLCHGHHLYRFLIDGMPALDPSATGTGHDDRGVAMSIVAVS